jgi:hypothetical protein
LPDAGLSPFPTPAGSDANRVDRNPVKKAAPAPTTSTPPVVTPVEQAMTATLHEARALRSGLSRLMRGGSVFAGAVIVLLGILVFQSGSSAARPNRQSTAAATNVDRVPAALPTPPADTHAFIELGLTTSPRAAMFRIDDGPWVAGPYTANVPHDDREHEVHVAANGYFPRAVKLRFSKDTQLDIVLQKIPDPTARWHHPSPR